MIFPRVPIALVLALTALAAACSRPEGPPADLILHGGVVWTADAARPRAQAVAVGGDRFVAVGSDREVLALAGEGTRVIDLEGRFAVPGFNDNHVHLASAARFLEFNIMATGSQDEFVARVQEVVADLAPGEWILGGFWGAYDQWARGSAGGEAREPFTPDLARVAELTREHPLFIRRFDGSEFAANAAALAAAGLDPESPAAPGVEVVRDPSGRPTGILRGAGVEPLFAEVVPTDFSRDRRLAQTRRALAAAREHGVTSLSDMSDDEQLAIYRALRERGELTARVDFRYPLERWRDAAASGPGDEWIRFGRLKGHIDGIMGTSTARFFAPYDHDPGNRGRWRPLMVDEAGQFVEGKFLGYMLDADRAGLELTVHAIGDEANHLLLDYLEELARRNGPRDRRFRLVHAQVLAPEDIPRLGQLGVIAEVQPFHLADDMRWMEERIGRERCRGAYAFRSIAEGGAVLAFGSDWPGTAAAEYPIDPMLGLYAAVTRKTLAGQPEGGWFPEQTVGIEEALRAYTVNNAYASFEEDLKGSITVGQLADLAVLSQNLLEVEPEEILATEVLYTVVGGRVVHERATNPSPRP